MTEFFKIDGFEELEVLSMVGQSASFPKHYHETFCVSLITDGIECMEVGKNRIYSEANFISITNPQEIHSNPLLANNLKLSFHTLYISQKLMDRIANRKHVFFAKRSFKDVRLNTSFLNFINSLKEQNNDLKIDLLSKFILRLIEHSTESEVTDEFTFKSNWEDVFEFINENFKNNINLDLIAANVEMDKFKFAKAFKYFCGMSPMNYVLMKRIFAAKEAITKDSNLTVAAYEYNFTDMAHFSKQFKRFIGLSPKKYQRSLSE